MSALQPYATIGSGVEVRASSIPGGGNGLWTSRRFARNELITEYVGSIIDHQTALKRREKGRASHVRVLNSQFRYIDGLKKPKPGAGGASFANDARDPNRNNSVFICRFDRKTGRDHVFLKATRDLPPGTEVFVSYGKTYWLQSKQQPAPLQQKELERRRDQHKLPPSQQQMPVQQHSMADGNLQGVAWCTRAAAAKLQHQQQHELQAASSDSQASGWIIQPLAAGQAAAALQVQHAAGLLGMPGLLPYQLAHPHGAAAVLSPDLLQPATFTDQPMQLQLPAGWPLQQTWLAGSAAGQLQGASSGGSQNSEESACAPLVGFDDSSRQPVVGQAGTSLPWQFTLVGPAGLQAAAAADGTDSAQHQLVTGMPAEQWPQQKLKSPQQAARRAGSAGRGPKRAQQQQQQELRRSKRPRQISCRVAAVEEPRHDATEQQQQLRRSSRRRQTSCRLADAAEEQEPDGVSKQEQPQEEQPQEEQPQEQQQLRRSENNHPPLNGLLVR